MTTKLEAVRAACRDLDEIEGRLKDNAETRTRLDAEDALLIERRRKGKQELATLIGAEDDEDEGAERTGEKMMLVYGMIRDNPGIDYKQIAQGVYGSDDAKQRDKVRSIVNQLKNKGRLRQIEPGKYAVIEPGGLPDLSPDDDSLPAV